MMGGGRGRKGTVRQGRGYVLNRQTLLPHEHEQPRQYTRRRQAQHLLERRRHKSQNSARMQESAPALLINPFHLFHLDFLLSVYGDGDLFPLHMHQTLRMQRRLRQQPIRGRDPQDPTEGGGGAEEDDVPGEAAGFLGAVAVDGADNAADFVVEEEEDGDDEARDDGREDPSHGELPELDEEDGAIGIGGPEGSAYAQGGSIQTRELADMWQADEDDNADRGRVLGQAHTDVPVEQRFPALGGGEEDGEQHGACCADDGVEEGSEGEGGVGALELLDRFVEVDDAVEEGEDLGGEGGDVAHRVVVSVDDGEGVVHPAGVDEGPGHEREEGDLGGKGSVKVSVERGAGDGG